MHSLPVFAESVKIPPSGFHIIDGEGWTHYVSADLVDDISEWPFVPNPHMQFADFCAYAFRCRPGSYPMHAWERPVVIT